MIRPSKKAAGSIQPTIQQPWVAQQYIAGKEYCTYSIAIDGQLRAHACYQTPYRAGKGAGIYFKPVLSETIKNIVSDFIKAISYTGQICFDFIENDAGQIYVIECNPRSSSGIHCLAAQENFIDCFEVDSSTLHEPKETIPKMLRSAMLMHSYRYNWMKCYKAIKEAEDVIAHSIDTNVSKNLWRSVVEIAIICIKQRKGMNVVSTQDIEWNGEDILCQ